MLSAIVIQGELTILLKWIGDTDRIECHRVTGDLPIHAGGGVDDTGPYIKATATYRAGVAHDPENEELTKGLRRALDAFGKTSISAEGQELLERAMAHPEFLALLSDPVKRRMFDDKYSKK